jgi:hypothetical protein
MEPKRLLEIEQQARLYGAANCWTGTSGTLAKYVMELLTELRESRGYTGEDCPSTSGAKP